MTLISLADVAVSFGATTLLKDVSVTIARGERWGIIGRNGAGKTTLFQILTGRIQPTRGAVARQPGLTVSLLDQHRDFGDATTVWEAAAAAYAPLIAIEKELNVLGEQLGDGDETLMDRYGRLQEKFMHEGGYDFPARVDKVLQGLGFDAVESRTRMLAGLSGGERGRVGLAGQLAAPAELLLLDEPTNHLDLETTQWLQTYLGELGETVVVISHDRAFLDETVDHVLHVTGGTTHSYTGGYSAFVSQREERMLTFQRQLDKQQKFIAKEEEYIRRHLAGVNSSQAKGRRSKLGRLPRLSPPPGESDAMSLRLEIGDRGGDRVLHTNKLRVTVGDRVLLDDVTLTAMRADVIALVGPNGAGKSTLIATLLGARDAAAGGATVGGSVHAAWYRQDLGQLPLERTIFEAIQDVRPLWGRGHIQGHLGAFGFSGDSVMRTISTLSGGERARVALALIMLQKANLLVLDEPTNHLDVESIEALEDAIESYEGTVILVSHDRAFLRELATRVWSFDGTRLRDFDGPFVEWEVAERERRSKLASVAAAAVQGRKAQEKAATQKSKGQDDRDVNARKSAKRAADDAEREVVRLEERVRKVQRSLEDGDLYDGTPEKAREAGRLEKELAAAQRLLDDAMTSWAERTAALERS
ncbi:MAG: ABC-F family ATP-binding cassette domain-containing protein [Gemmatimonadaceae bacterium]|nr:ABC-F family ATP-binding cassette domain-containing protein [Gemmatimonadaceae bacterium]